MITFAVVFTDHFDSKLNRTAVIVEARDRAHAIHLATRSPSWAEQMALETVEIYRVDGPVIKEETV